MQTPWTGTIGATALAAMLCATTDGRTQTLEEIRDALRESARHSRYPAFIATLSDLAEDAELSGGHITISGDPDTNLTNLVMPWRDNFLRNERGHSLRVEATAGYVSADVKLPDLWSGALPGLETDVHSRYQAFALGVGIGPSFLLPDGGILEPLVHGGIAYAHNDTDYGGPGALLGAALADGILFNWDGVYGSYGASLALRPKGTMFDDVETKPLLRYDVRRTEGLHVDDPAQDAGDTIHWATLRVDLSAATGWKFNDQPVRWNADIGYRYFFGVGGDVLGFDDFFELGLGLGFDVTDRLPVNELQFGGSILYGENVFGWSIGVSARF